MLIEWSDSLSVGNPTLDEQHKTLVGKVNELHDACLQRKAEERLEDIVSFLEGYAKEHFSYEEIYFRGHGFPKAGEHCAMHAEFLRTVSELRGELDEKGPSALMAVEVMNFCSRWLLNHIQRADKAYCVFIKTGRCPD